MAYTTAEAHSRILEDLATVIDDISLASACLGEAYEHLHGGSADRLENDLFRPVSAAMAKARRTQTGFAARVGRDAPALEEQSAGAGSRDVKLFVDRAMSACAEASHTLAELQDSMMPIEAGDAELRSGIAEIRELVDGMPARAREFTRLLGR
ncbi:MAG: hypothetical protein QOG62_263 [Thermoleophilaceae bacterium]|nr:hypothetical protein [Thermoleophilaceae bacterium]